MPPDAPEVAIDQAVRARFSITDPIVVLVRTKDPAGVFNVRTLGLIRDLSAELSQIEGVVAADITSLATEHGDRFVPGTLNFSRFLEPFPETPEQLALLRDDVRAIGLYHGTVVSQDERAASILVGCPATADRVPLVRRIQALADASSTDRDRVQVIGPPVAESLLGLHILEDLGLPRALTPAIVARNAPAPAHQLPLLAYFRRLVGGYLGLVPLGILLMTAVFALSFRNAPAVILPLAEVGPCMIFVFGVMGWADVPIYLTTTILPVILTFAGVTDEIHVFSHHTRRRRIEPQQPASRAVSETMAEMSSPIIKTSLTTAIGFLSFALSPMAPVVAFGIFAGVGMLFCLVWSLTVVPAMLVLADPRPARAPSNLAGPGVAGRLESWFGRLAAFGTRRRVIILVLLGLGVLALPFGVGRLGVQDSWINGFAADSDFYDATKYFDEEFFGSHVLLAGLEAPALELRGDIVAADLDHHQMKLPAEVQIDPQSLVHTHVEFIRPDPPPVSDPNTVLGSRWNRWPAWIESAEKIEGRLVIRTPRTAGSPVFSMQPDPGETFRFEIEGRPFLKPSTLRLAEAFAQFLRREGSNTVGGALGPADYLATAQYIVHLRDPSKRVIPDQPEQVQWTWQQLERIRGELRRRQLVTAGYDAALVTVFLKNANFVDTRRLLEQIRAYEREQLAPHGVHVQLAGDVAVSQTLIDAIVSTQVRSLLPSLVGILAIVSVLHRSLRWGLLCVLPCAVAIALNFAVMGWLNIPLGVATSMFASITLGIGVDFAIHIVERYRRSVAAGLDPHAAVADALMLCGPGIVVDALAVGLGFGVLLFSQVPANAYLGLVTLVCVTACLVLTLLGLPALLTLWSPRAEAPGDPRP